MQKVKIPNEKKYAKARKQHGRCFWCLTKFYNGETPHAEHVYPESEGGQLWVASCSRCNYYKGTQHPFRFWFRRLVELARLDISEHGLPNRFGTDGSDTVSRYLTDTDDILLLDYLRSGGARGLNADCHRELLELGQHISSSGPYLQFQVNGMWNQAFVHAFPGVDKTDQGYIYQDYEDCYRQFVAGVRRSSRARSQIAYRTWQDLELRYFQPTDELLMAQSDAIAETGKSASKVGLLAKIGRLMRGFPARLTHGNS
jgi:Zn-finger protein